MKGRKKVGICSLDGVFGVPKQLLVGGADKAVPCQKSSSGLVYDNTSAVFKQDGTCFEEEVFGVPKNRSGGTRSGLTLPGCVVLGGTSAAPLQQPGTSILVLRVRFWKYHEDVWEAPRQNFLEGRENPAMSFTDLLAPLCDDELWLSEAVLDAEGGTLSNHKIEVMRDGDNASQSTVCLQEDLVSSEDDGWTGELSNSDDESLTWEDLVGVDIQARDF
eukprot:1433004-Amphidinium_carterae.1